MEKESYVRSLRQYAAECVTAIRGISGVDVHVSANVVWELEYFHLYPTFVFDETPAKLLWYPRM